MLIKNGTTPRIPVTMLLALNGSELLGITPTAKISKNGGAFVDMANAVIEVGLGEYYVTPTAAETNTDGPLKIRVLGVGATPWRETHQVYTTLDTSTNTVVNSILAAVNSIKNIVTNIGRRR